jgi:hypothetical protein
MFSRVMIFCLLFCQLALADDETSNWLRQADGFRLPADEVQVETEIRLFKKGELQKTRDYTVYLKPGRRSLVLFRSPNEVGQKMLLLDDKFWIILPSSRRPVRITASQKLLGEASSGDIATLTWSEDYSGELKGKELVDGTPCRVLQLHATRKGVTYEGIELYLAEQDNRPIRANLFVASGKLAKVAHFEMGELNGRRQVVAMRLVDRIQTTRVTEIRYLDMRPHATPDKLFNPAYLIRNDISQ